MVSQQLELYRMSVVLLLTSHTVSTYAILYID